jgi:hypothetical protein
MSAKSARADRRCFRFLQHFPAVNQASSSGCHCTPNLPRWTSAALLRE